MLDHAGCGVMDWLVMSFMSGGAFAMFLLVLLMITALVRYVLTGRFRGPV